LGTAKAARIATMAMTTISSSRVTPFLFKTRGHLFKPAMLLRYEKLTQLMGGVNLTKYYSSCPNMARPPWPPILLYSGTSAVASIVYPTTNVLATA